MPHSDYFQDHDRFKGPCKQFGCRLQLVLPVGYHRHLYWEKVSIHQTQLSLIKFPYIITFYCVWEEGTAVMTDSPLQLCLSMIPNERMGKRMLFFSSYLKVQQDPQWPWFFTGLTIPSSLQSFCNIENNITHREMIKIYSIEH